MNENAASRPAGSTDVLLTIDVTDFGPIAKASVALRPLTVFIGPSNTGKSYLAILLYALHRCFGDREDSLSWVDPFGGLIGDWSAEDPLPAPVREHLHDWLLASAGAGSPAALPADVAQHVRSVLERAEGLDLRLERELKRCFGADRVDALVRIPGANGGARVDLGFPRSIGDEGALYRLEVSDGSTHFSGRLPAAFRTGHDLFPPNAREYGGVHDDEEGRKTLNAVFRSLAGLIFDSLIGPIPNAYYLPADRTGVMNSHQVLASALVQSAARPPRKGPILSGVLADFISGLIAMSSYERPSEGEGVTADSAARLESRVLQGAIRLNRPAAGYPTYSYHPQGWATALPLMRASSMVSELAPVVLYLRHFVRPGELLIIEEPEAHLHPGMQAEFTRELARLVRTGVRIVMTTHSEWVLEVLGNLVRMSSVPETDRDGLSDADCALRPDHVGAWLFVPLDGSEGVEVKEIELDPETGVYPTDFDDVSETLYNDGAAIFNRIQGHGTE
jgi:hypothetical protein